MCSKGPYHWLISTPSGENSCQRTVLCVVTKLSETFSQRQLAMSIQQINKKSVCVCVCVCVCVLQRRQGAMKSRAISKLTDIARSHTSRANHNRAPTTAKDTHKGNNKIQGHNTLAIPPQIASCPLTNLCRGSVKPGGVTSTTHSHKATSHRPLDSSVVAAQTDGKFVEHARDKLLTREGAVCVCQSLLPVLCSQMLVSIEMDGGCSPNI
jgi:hypothetical protein